MTGKNPGNTSDAEWEEILRKNKEAEREVERQQKNFNSHKDRWQRSQEDNDK